MEKWTAVALIREISIIAFHSNMMKHPVWKSAALEFRKRW